MKRFFLTKSNLPKDMALVAAQVVKYRTTLLEIRSSYPTKVGAILISLNYLNSNDSLSPLLTLANAAPKLYWTEI